MAYNTIDLHNDQNNILLTEKNDVHDDNDIDYDLLNNFVIYLKLFELKESFNKNLEYLYKNPYILYMLALLFDVFDNMLDYCIVAKNFVEVKVNHLKKILGNENYLNEIYLINDNNFLKLINIDIDLETIDKDKFKKIFHHLNLEIDDFSSILVKYTYKDKQYRLYINYHSLEDNVYKIPLEIEDMKNKINEKYSKEILHTFNNECDDIENAIINDIDIKDIIQECNGPFYDFGLLLNNKIYVKYLMHELCLDKLTNLHIKYKNFHLDEDKMELMEHVIKIENEDEYISSEIIDKFIKN